MRKKRVAGPRPFVEWLSTGRDRAIPLLEELLAVPPPGRDAWLAAHPGARTVHVLHGLLYQAEAEPAQALEVTGFVVRHIDSATTPPEAAFAHTFVRGWAWEARALALLASGDHAAALQAHERAGSIFRQEPRARPELRKVERAAALFRPGLVASLLRDTPPAKWPELAKREELRSSAALEQLSAEVVSRVDVVPLEAAAIAEVATAIADALDGVTDPVRSKLRAYAWRNRGMAYAALARDQDALAALSHAVRILDPFPELARDRAVVVYGLATVLSEAGRHDESMALGRYGEAIAAYRQVVAEAERIGEWNLLASAHNNLAHSLIELSDFTAAASHLDRAAALFQSLGQLLSVSRAELARGRMLLRKGDVEAALLQLHSVREQFLRQNLVEEAGLCGLDIVEAHLMRGATIEAEAFARQIVREFTAAHLNARAITALGYLSETIAAREASGATVERVRRYLGTLRRTPDAEFRATA